MSRGVLTPTGTGKRRFIGTEGSSRPPIHDVHSPTDLLPPEPRKEDRAKSPFLRVLIEICQAFAKGLRHPFGSKCSKCGSALALEEPFSGVGYTATHQYRCVSCGSAFLLYYYDSAPSD